MDNKYNEGLHRSTQRAWFITAETGIKSTRWTPNQKKQATGLLVSEWKNDIISKSAAGEYIYSCVSGGWRCTTNALRVNYAAGRLVAEVALAGLVEEGVSAVGPMAGDLLPGEVLALDAVAPQMAPLDAGFATLDPGHLGDLGQGSGLDGRPAAHPGGHGTSGGGGSSWLGHSAARAKKRRNVRMGVMDTPCLFCT